MPEGDFVEALIALRRGDVRFIVVGGIAAVLGGATIGTFDLDIVHDREPGNIARLVAVLEQMDAVYKMQRERRLKPNASHLSSVGHHNLVTSQVMLDVLGTIGRGLSFEDLLPDTTEMEIGEGVRVRVLNLAKIIEIKEQLATPKDLAALPVLRQTLALKTALK
jgi:hypothetical protein